MKKVIFDLDGVLADFTKGYRGLASQMFGVPFYTTATRPHAEWNDPDLTKEQDEAIWQIIGKAETGFWRELDSLATDEEWDRIADLSDKADVYFVTNRWAADAKQQSEAWLNWYLPHYSVILAKSKGAIAKHLGAHWAIDDMWQNIWDMGHHCWSYAMTRPHNAQYDWPYRVNKLSEFLDIVEKGIE